jgi:hypothetical protein
MLGKGVIGVSPTQATEHPETTAGSQHSPSARWLEIAVGLAAGLSGLILIIFTGIILFNGLSADSTTRITRLVLLAIGTPISVLLVTSSWRLVSGKGEKHGGFLFSPVVLLALGLLFVFADQLYEGESEGSVMFMLGLTAMYFAVKRL